MRKLVYMMTLLLMLGYGSQAQKARSSVDSMMAVAHQLLTGKGGMPVDKEQAVQLYMMCVQHGDARAMNALGMCCKQGTGIAVNYVEALKWFTKAGNAGYNKAWYNLGMMYKYGLGTEIDYEKAYNIYSMGAAANDPSAWFAKGYMLYKGLGCIQNYTEAYNLFKQGAAAGKPNSMYFLGLCLRNGYGTMQNTSEAINWLNKAAALGYSVADEELAQQAPENADITGSLLQKIKEAKAIIKNSMGVNKYTKVKHNMPANEIEGEYNGYLLKYDWSGQHVVRADKLNVKLQYDKDTLSGTWIENDTLSIPITGFLTPQGVVFTQMQYAKKDHYDPVVAEVLNFTKASFQLIPNDKEVYLAGNLQMYSVNRKEPAKPMYVALVRTAKADSIENKNITLRNEDGTPIVIKNLSAYPNPFTNTVTLDFELKQKGQVETQLLTLDERVVYRNPAGVLDAGSYTLQIQPQQIASGTYLLRLVCGKNAQTVKLIKL